ncbi:putative deoxyribonuclease TATDN2 [Dermacentor silvarum]|uniref:putative deoxyribonuclease TATDN2 n=1 Tax=Dermacentor silvarum TaxID=543639 RepID=UPI002101C2E9|nr:putative deoxyribonuclease TATDN2 [Dermacentor silvarum]
MLPFAGQRRPCSAMSCCESEQSSRPLPASKTATLRSPVAKRWPYTLSSEVGLIDTHCHLDFLFRKTGHQGSYAQFRIRHQATFPSCYEGCVAIFCDPATFKKRHLWQGLLSEQGVWGAFGCHPHMARHYDEDVEEDLIAALEQRSVVALGEIGLDYSAKNKCDRMMQQRVFRRQLQLARNGRLPLVIHSRDSSHDTLRILKEMVPGDWPIHRHCFTGDWSEAQLWMDTFPNLYLGLTPLVGFPNAGPVAEVGRRIPLERLLLETDAPYFLPKSESGCLAQSHPGMAIHVATWLSNVRKINVQDILEAVRENTREIYRI